MVVEDPEGMVVKDPERMVVKDPERMVVKDPEGRDLTEMDSTLRIMCRLGWI